MAPAQKVSARGAQSLHAFAFAFADGTADLSYSPTNSGTQVNASIINGRAIAPQLLRHTNHPPGSAVLCSPG